MFDRSLLPSPATYYGQYFNFKTRKKALVQCCFHADKTASLSLDLATGRFHCFGCEAGGGDVLDFHLLKTGLTFADAAKDLGAWHDDRHDTPEARAERRRKIEQADREHKARQEQAAREEQAAAQAFIPLVATITSQCTIPMLETPYCAAKVISTHNLLTIEADRLQRFKAPADPQKTIGYGLNGALTVAVLETLAGQPVALQVFDGQPDAKGKFARRFVGRPVALGAYYRLGDWSAPTVIVLTEGMADAVTCFEAGAWPVIAALSKSQLLNTAQAVKAKYPGALVVIVGDNDSNSEGQKAARSAAAAVMGVCVIPDGEGIKDANDLHRHHGLQAVKDMIDAAIAQQPVTPDETIVTADLDAGADSEATALDRLAGLSTIDYERVRADQAKKLNIRATALDKLVAAKRSEQDDTPDPDAEAIRQGTYFYLDEENPILEKRGVYFVGMNREGKYLPPQQICGVLRIKALTRNQDHQEHGFLLEWLDRDNHRHTWSMPAELFKGDGADYRGQLLSSGLYIAPTTHARLKLAEYIQNHHTPNRALCVDKTGWYEQLYVTPHHTYGQQSETEQVIYQSSQSFISGYTQRGKLEDWREHVSLPCTGNSRLVFAVSVAFAGCLLRLAHEESGGFHFRGNSSTGKSTAQHLACSVFGSRDYKQTWRATINGLEGIAALYNDGLLVLDEMGQASNQAIGETIYVLGNERGKIRSQRSLIPRKNLTWKLLFLSSGELSLEQMMRDAGQKTKAGQEVRLVDIAADAGKQMGMVEQLNGFASAKELMDTLNSRTSQYYGTAGHAFLAAVANQPEGIADFLKHVKQAYLMQHVKAGASEQVLRVASRFALVAAAGEMATDEGITGWPKGEANRASIQCFQAWLEGRGGTGNQEVRAIKSQVRAFFEAHGESRFADWDDTGSDSARTVINRAGFRRKQEDGDIYAVLPEAYSKDICNGFDVRTVNKVLAEAGWIEPDKDGKASQRQYLPGLGRTRVYLFTSQMWQEENM